jgi:heme exporter protein CcmD
MLHWFDPGKYAAFVATAYGVSALVLGALVVDSLWRARRWRKAAERARPTKAIKP